MGYGTRSQTVTVAAGQTLTLDFELTVQALVLDNLVVVGYGTRSQATVSGSVSAVTAASIERNSASTAATALVGKIQGINTRMQQGFEAMVSTATGSGDRIPGDVSDGRPGSVISLQIRNMGSPLFVIDGVPTADPQVFNNLNVGDIESVSILKDASAAVYGFRAANGVVLVETKRGGRDEPPQIQVDGWYGWQNIARYHYADPLNAYDYLFSRVDSNNNLRQPASVSK
jgi:TonB-dependent SusC/RagA subfamily outer membrane receptor